MSDERYDGTNGNGYQPTGNGEVGTPPGAENAPPADPANLRLLKFDQSNIAGAATWLERNLEDMIKYNAAYARLQRERFCSLVAVGFTPDQALYLLCNSAMFGK